MKKQEPEQHSNEDLVKFISLIKVIPIDTFKDTTKLEAALRTLGVEDQDKQNMLQALETHLSKMMSKEAGENTQVFYSYPEALDHFFAHVYKDYLKKAPKHMKDALYRAKAEYERKKIISDGRIHQMLDLAGYKIIYIDDKLRITYPSI